MEKYKLSGDKAGLLKVISYYHIHSDEMTEAEKEIHEKLLKEEKLKIYLLEQSEVTGDDTYDSIVVIAKSEEEARKIHPMEFVTHKKGVWMVEGSDGVEYEYQGELIGKDWVDFHEYHGDYPCKDWVDYSDRDKIKVTLLGVADSEQVAGVVCKSFNAG